jgi:rhodanese-related sulfurtransferase
MKIFANLLFILISSMGFSQKTIPEVLEKMNSKSVAYITASELQFCNNCILLDTREISEFNVSHLKNAIHVGFEKFNKKKLPRFLKVKNAKIIVYCSIGVRSEKIGEKLIKSGYKNVFNLYGGIFEWKNNGGKVFDNQENETQNVHAFSKEWSVYLDKGNKVYE